MTIFFRRPSSGPSFTRDDNGYRYIPDESVGHGRHVRKDSIANWMSQVPSANLSGESAVRGRHVRETSGDTSVTRVSERQLSPSSPVQVITPPIAESAPIGEPFVSFIPNVAVRGNLASPRPIWIPEISPLPLDLLPTGTDSTDATEFLRFHLTRKLGRRTLLIIALLVALVAGAGLWWKVGRGNVATPPARVAVAASTAKTVVTLTGGSDSLSQLRQSLARDGHGGLISSVPGGAVEVNADIVVGPKATLSVTGSALLLRSDPQMHVRLTAQGGDLNFDDDTITSWTAQGAVDSDPIGGRADIVATGRGSDLSFTNSDVVALGTDTNDPGVSWRQGASGTVLNSHFSRNWRGAYAYKSGTLDIIDSSFTGSEEDGVLLLDPGSKSTVENSTFADNTQSGLAVNGTVGTLTLANDTADNNHDAGLFVHAPIEDVSITGGLFYDNEQFGISADGGRLSVDSTKVWANGTGMFIDGGSTSVRGSYLSSNTQDGMYVSGNSVVVAASDRFDHNAASGLWVADGRVSATSGLFYENLNGIRIAGFSHSFLATGNTISGNIKDGVALDVAPGIHIHGNVIDGNGNSAISTDKAYNIDGMVKQNTVHDNQTSSRVRASD